MVGNSLAYNIRQVLTNCESAARHAHRDPHGVRLIAVSKEIESGLIQQAHALGLHNFGENYVQEWSRKAEELNISSLNWHFIGALQSNKVKTVVGRVSLIHSLDRDSLAQEINRQSQMLNLRQRVLVELNVAGESSKSGVALSEIKACLSKWNQLPHLDLCGLMVMPPLQTKAEDNRTHFRKAQELLIQLRPLVPHHSWNELSMGTTQDYTIAIEEGATLVRVGTALFGPRPAKGVT